MAGTPGNLRRTSPDGIAWTERLSASKVGLWAIASSGTDFVTTGVIGTILQSGSFIPEPRIRHLRFHEDGFRFQIATTPGLAYRMEASTDLTTWTELNDLIAESEVSDFADNTAPGIERRFYRVLLLP